MLLAAASGVLAADFLTAAVHWFEDTYLPYTNAPGILGEIARDNEMHHFIPYSITTGTYWDNVKVSVFLLAVVAAPLALCAPGWVYKNRVFLGFMLAAMAASNLIHRFEHERDCTRPPAITFLQRAGVLCSREQHASHHASSNINYGILLGFTNPVYDGIGIWRVLEGALAAVGVPVKDRKKGVEEYKGLYDPWLRANSKAACPKIVSDARLKVYARVLRDAKNAEMAAAD